MYNSCAVFNIDQNGVVKYKNGMKFIRVGVAETEKDSRLIKLVEYDAHVPSGLKKLVDTAVLKCCIPNELFEFKVHYNSIPDSCEEELEQLV